MMLIQRPRLRTSGHPHLCPPSSSPNCAPGFYLFSLLSTFLPVCSSPPGKGPLLSPELSAASELAPDLKPLQEALNLGALRKISPSPCFAQKSMEAQGCGRCLRSSSICGGSETCSWFLPREKTPEHGSVATHRGVWTAGGRPAPSPGSLHLGRHV